MMCYFKAEEMNNILGGEFTMFAKNTQLKLKTSEGVQHFGLRKLSVGLASVALATTFLVAGPGQVKAETTASSAETGVSQMAVPNEQTEDASGSETNQENSIAKKSTVLSNENRGAANDSNKQDDGLKKEGSTELTTLAANNQKDLIFDSSRKALSSDSKDAEKVNTLSSSNEKKINSKEQLAGSKAVALSKNGS